MLVILSAVSLATGTGADGLQMYIAGGIALIVLYFAVLYACRARDGAPHVLARTTNRAQLLAFGLTTMLCFGLGMIVHDIF